MRRAVQVLRTLCPGRCTKATCCACCERCWRSPSPPSAMQARMHHASARVSDGCLTWALYRRVWLPPPNDRLTRAATSSTPELATQQTTVAERACAAMSGSGIGRFTSVDGSRRRRGDRQSLELVSVCRDLPSGDNATVTEAWCDQGELYAGLRRKRSGTCSDRLMTRRTAHHPQNLVATTSGKEHMLLRCTCGTLNTCTACLVTRAPGAWVCSIIQHAH
jgi:hypothetical protein